MAEAAHAVHIDPGLDGHDHAGLQHRLIAGREERQLVNVDTDAVPGAVNEGAAKPRLFDETARGTVHLLARHTGPDRIEGRLLPTSASAAPIPMSSSSWSSFTIRRASTNPRTGTNGSPHASER